MTPSRRSSGALLAALALATGSCLPPRVGDIRPEVARTRVRVVAETPDTGLAAAAAAAVRDYRRLEARGVRVDSASGARWHLYVAVRRGPDAVRLVGRLVSVETAVVEAGASVTLEPGRHWSRAMPELIHLLLRRPRPPDTP